MKPLWPAHYVPPRQYATGSDVVRYVAKAYGITPAELVGSNRKASLVRARAAAIAILVRRGNGYAGTGRIMKRDHTTIMHAMKRLPDHMRACPSVAVVIHDFMLRH